MLGNGRVTIPREQLGVFKCEFCKDEVFKIVSGVSFVFDKLSPKGKMAPQPVTMYQCMSCGGYLKQNKDGSYQIVHTRKQPPMDGDEWKKPEGNW